MYPQETLSIAADLVAVCRKKDVLIATAESCTGGLIAAAITSVSGASAVFERGFNTYSNLAKNELLGVSLDDIDSHGAVSNVVARQMAEGALHAAPVQLTAAVTGIAGPDGGSKDKPVGTVHIAAAYASKTVQGDLGARQRGYVLRDHRFVFPGNRDAVRLATVNEALKMMRELLQPGSRAPYKNALKSC